MRPSVRAEKYIPDMKTKQKIPHVRKVDETRDRCCYGNDNGTDGHTDRQTDGQTECDAICGPLLGRRAA